MDFGSVLDVIQIPFGSADLVLAGVIESVNFVLTQVGDIANGLLGSVSGLSA